MKRILAVILCFCFSIGFVACEEPQTENDEKSIVLINGFESLAEMDTFTNFGVLGKISVNTQKEYVKSGEKSAKILVTSDPYKAAAPYVSQAFELKKREKNYTNFSDVGFLTLQIYNPQSETLRIGLQLVHKYSTGMREYFDVLPNAWTKIQYTVTREYIPKLESMNNIPYVSDLRIYFDRQEQDTIFYIDDLYLYKTKTTYEDVSMRLKRDEICSFDSGWQVAFTQLEHGGLDVLMPTISMETVTTSTNGGGSLKIIAPAGLGSYKETERWPGVALNKDMLKLVNWGSYSGSAKFCFDVYTPLTNSVDEIWISAYADGIRYFSGPAEKLVPGRWITISYTVDEMNSTWEWTEDRNFATTESISVRYGEETGVERVFYLDNFRMEIV